jgi:hypothetical protein
MLKKIGLSLRVNFTNDFHYSDSQIEMSTSTSESIPLALYC